MTRPRRSFCGRCLFGFRQISNASLSASWRCSTRQRYCKTFGYLPGTGWRDCLKFEKVSNALGSTIGGAYASAGLVTTLTMSR